MTKLDYLKALALCLTLPACVEMGDPDDPELAETEQALTASYLNFDIGYGEGYLSPVPETRTVDAPIADGMVGWASPGSTTVLGITIRQPAFKTKAVNANRWGYAHLKYSGTVPATGTCTLDSPGIIVDGSTYVKGKNPFPYTGTDDAVARSKLKAKAWVNGSLAYNHYWSPGSDATKSESRSKSFDKTYYLQNGPTFYATAGSHIEVDIYLENYAWSNSEGEASVSIYYFGMLANSNPDLVAINCY
ncbi:MAG TPA: hypothetical protein VIV11_03370 [Kofleriaceae bacterium]